MAIAELIRQHEQDVTGRISRRYADRCPRCESRERFRRHEIRRRTFYCELAARATAIQSWLVRWRCCNCDLTFTDYPPFALPHKRHVKPTVFEMAEKVVRGTATYRRTAKNQAAHSSVWRWLTWLSGLYEKGQECLRFVLGVEPHSILHRKPYLVHPRKSRSKERASVLEIAYQTLDRIMAFERVVAEKYSPT